MSSLFISSLRRVVDFTLINLFVLSSSVVTISVLNLPPIYRHSLFTIPRYSIFLEPPPRLSISLNVPLQLDVPSFPDNHPFCPKTDTPSRRCTFLTSPLSDLDIVRSLVPPPHLDSTLLPLCCFSANPSPIARSCCSALLSHTFVLPRILSLSLTLSATDLAFLSPFQSLAFHCIFLQPFLGNPTSHTYTRDYACTHTHTYTHTLILHRVDPHFD